MANNNMFSQLANQNEVKTQFKEAPEEAQKASERAMGGGAYKQDPEYAILPKISTSQVKSFEWMDDQDRSVFDGAYVYKKGKKNSTKTVTNFVVALRFALIRPFSGYSQFDPVSGKPLCQTIASFPEDGEKYNKFGNNPGEIPTYGPAEYENKYTPTSFNKRQGFYGKKGMFCADCVACGDHITSVQTESGENVDVQCNGQGGLIVAISEFGIPARSSSGEEEIQWFSYDEIYKQTDDEVEEEYQLFQNMPLVRLNISAKTFNRKGRFSVWSDEYKNSSANDKKASANYVPQDVQNIASYLESLRRDRLSDGRPWVKVVEDEEGYYRNLYRGLHEIYFAYPRSEETKVKTAVVPMMRLADNIEEFSVNQLDMAANSIVGDYYLPYLDTQIQEKGINPYEPFEPKELKEAKNQTSLVEQNVKGSNGQVQQINGSDTNSTPNIDVVQEVYNNNDNS
jgi:hypothetical protein